MVMLKTRENENEISEGDKYARTEEELYEKAIALLEKCKIKARHSGQKVPESTAETSRRGVVKNADHTDERPNERASRESLAGRWRRLRG